MEVEFSLLNARLAEKADQMELAEEQLWKLFALYQGKEWTGSIEYPGSFNVRDTQREYQQLTQAKSAATSPEALAIIDFRLREMLEDPTLMMMPETPEMESAMEMEAMMPPAFQPHLMTDPATGEQRVASTEAEHLALAAQDWVHNE
jgi:hypothetical protein